MPKANIIPIKYLEQGDFFNMQLTPKELRSRPHMVSTTNAIRFRMIPINYRGYALPLMVPQIRSYIEFWNVDYKYVNPGIKTAVKKSAKEACKSALIYFSFSAFYGPVAGLAGIGC